MSGFRFSWKSKRNLRQVHPDLQNLAIRTLGVSPIDFGIIEGARSFERQLGLQKTGASRTLNSRHLRRKSLSLPEFFPPVSHAIDFACYIQGEIAWDWPLYEQVGEIFKETAREMEIPITWGGDWKSLRDGPHIELTWDAYPVEIGDQE